MKQTRRLIFLLFLSTAIAQTFPSVLRAEDGQAVAQNSPTELTGQVVGVDPDNSELTVKYIDENSETLFVTATFTITAETQILKGAEPIALIELEGNEVTLWYSTDEMGTHVVSRVVMQ